MSLVAPLIVLLAIIAVGIVLLRLGLRMARKGRSAKQ
jgi:hypothetical protein